MTAFQGLDDRRKSEVNVVCGSKFVLRNPSGQVSAIWP